MKLRSVLSLVTVAVSAGLIFPSAALAARAPTQVTIHGPQGDFYGKVKSDKTSCIKQRTVKVFKIKSSGPVKIASDVSNNEGQWSVGNTGYKNGRFYAKATRTDACKAGVSETIRLVDGVEQD